MDIARARLAIALAIATSAALAGCAPIRFRVKMPGCNSEAVLPADCSTGSYLYPVREHVEGVCVKSVIFNGKVMRWSQHFVFRCATSNSQKKGTTDETNSDSTGSPGPPSRRR